MAKFLLVCGSEMDKYYLIYKIGRGVMSMCAERI